MKFTIYIILFFVTVSCSTADFEKKIYNDLLYQEVVSKTNINNVYLVETSGDKLKALILYEKAYRQRDEENFFNREMVPNNFNFNSWPIDSFEIEKQKTLLLTNSDTTVYKWKKDDFIFDKLGIKKLEEINKKIKKGEESLNVEAIIISKPLISFDKKHALIFYSSFGYFFGGENRDKVFLMKKVNEEWIVETYFYDPRIMN